MTFLYFNVDIWGTVSDWFMVGITVITAYYLYKTLKSQKEVQETQTKLFKIESIRFRESIKPFFKYTKSNENYVKGEQKYNMIGIEIINENESLANFISVNFEKTKNVERVMIPRDYAAVDVKHLKKGDKAIILGFLFHDKTINVEHFKFEVTYQDISSIKYSQTVFCLLVDKEFNIYPQLPIMIE